MGCAHNDSTVQVCVCEEEKETRNNQVPPLSIQQGMYMMYRKGSETYRENEMGVV